MIELRHLTKSYMTKEGRNFIFRDVNFLIPGNASLGILGRNGAGKSTLMRLLGGLDVPDSGKIITHKTISWPVALGGGFQGSLTGRENVRFVSQIYGADRDEVRAKVAFVEDFADIGKYFDMPIKTYSSGMRSRLSFGLSMAFDFDYYLIDEVMSVGDASFQEKCSHIMADKRKHSNFILVSHTTSTIQAMCDVAILLEKGKLTLYDDVAEAIRRYEALH